MRRGTLLSLLFCWPVLAQVSDSSTSPKDAQARRLREIIEAAPALPLAEDRLVVKLPPGQTLGMVSGLAYDAKTRFLWLIQRGDQAEPVIAIDERGQVIHSFGKGLFVTPHSIRLDPEGHVWTVDSGRSELIEFSQGGHRLTTITLPKPPSSQPDFGGITDVAFAPNGIILISDGYSNAQILSTKIDGKLRHWGHPGSGPGQFQLPHALVVDEDGVVYVADRENGRIEEFTATGTYLREIAGLGRTYALALGQEGTIWAAMSPFNQPPGGSGWIVQFDRKTGKELGYIAVNEARSLHCLELDDAGRLLTDVGNEIVRFNRR